MVARIYIKPGMKPQGLYLPNWAINTKHNSDQEQRSLKETIWK